MAYLDQSQRNNRPVVFTGVALLHAAAAYALVTGLAVTYIKEVMPVLTAKNYPIEQPPPPSPQPKPSPQTEIQQAHPVTPKLPVDVFPTDNRNLADSPKEILPPPTDSIRVDLPKPQQTQSFTPRLAKPRGNPAAWVSTDDYPARDLREGNQGLTRFSLAVGADGRVQSCTVTASSGFPGLDKATCDNVSRRARFEPATDGDGNRVAGSYSGSIRWVIPQD